MVILLDIEVSAVAVPTQARWLASPFATSSDGMLVGRNANMVVLMDETGIV
jgi:hypothetical protein